MLHPFKISTALKPKFCKEYCFGVTEKDIYDKSSEIRFLGHCNYPHKNLER